MPCPRRETNPLKYLPRAAPDLRAFLSQHVKRKGNVFCCGECWHQAGRLKYKSHIPTHERAATSGIIDARARPNTMTRPLSCGKRAPRMVSKVVLPDPDRPKIRTRSPAE